MTYCSLSFYSSSLNTQQHHNDESLPLNWKMMRHESLVVNALHHRLTMGLIFYLLVSIQHVMDLFTFLCLFQYFPLPLCFQ